MLEYKGFRGSVETSERGFRGKLLDIADLVTYEAESASELPAEFEAAVDDYVATREALFGSGAEEAAGTTLSDSRMELERAGQVPGVDLECRISALVEMFRTRTYASQVSGMSTDQLVRYEHGTCAPSFIPLAKMAVAKGVRLEWLATGEGPMLAEDAEAKAASPELNESDTATPKGTGRPIPYSGT